MKCYKLIQSFLCTTGSFHQVGSVILLDEPKCTATKSMSRRGILKSSAWKDKTLDSYCSNILFSFCFQCTIASCLQHSLFLVIFFFIQYSGHILRNNVVSYQLNKDPHQTGAKGAFTARVGKSSMSCGSRLDIHPHLQVPVPATGISIR